MKFVAIVGSAQSETGGEFYNEHAFQGLSEVLGYPTVLAMASAPGWIGWFNRPLVRGFYIVAMNFWVLIRCRGYAATHYYLDFFVYRYSWLFMLYARFRGMKLLVVVHGFYHVLMPKGLRRTLVMLAGRLFISGCTEIVTTSKDTARRLHSELHVSGPPITTIYPGIERTWTEAEHSAVREKTASGPIRVLYVGMVIQDKGVIDLVEALHFLSGQGVEAELHIAGRTDIDPEYTEEVRRAAGDGAIRFHGFLSRQALCQLYLDSDIFVLPSHYETFGMVTMEAMQMGLPVIVAASGGVQEIVTHGENGLLYTPGNVEELAAHLRHLIESPELRERLRTAAVSSIDKFADWDEVRASYRKLAESIC